MNYEIHLLDEKTKKMLHHYESLFIPIPGDIIPLPPVEDGACFIVKVRLLPDSDSNRMVCFGTITSRGKYILN